MHEVDSQLQLAKDDTTGPIGVQPVEELIELLLGRVVVGSGAGMNSGVAGSTFRPN